MEKSSLNNLNIRKQLLSIYQNALDAVNGRKVVVNFFQKYSQTTPLALLAIGKAATQMAAGAFDIFGAQITHALIITKSGHLDKTLLPNYPITCLETAHPVPDESSLAAGQTLLDFIQNLPPQSPVLVLISGGASALVEVLVSGVTLADLQRVNAWLLASELDIHAMNRIRKSLSAIKGGRLAAYLKEHPVLNLLISDVPGDDLQAIGSGLLTPHSSTSLLSKERTHLETPFSRSPKGPKKEFTLPTWLQVLLAKAHPLAISTDFSNIKQHLIATPALARQAAAQNLQNAHYTVFNSETFIQGDAEAAGRTLAQQLKHAVPGFYIWSSETTVFLPEKPGQGGRCQHLALAAACELAAQKEVMLLAAGTDGNDGPGQVAGALVDGKTLARGKQKGFDAEQCLEKADAGRFLAASDDLIVTGPTGTNVMDILIAHVSR